LLAVIVADLGEHHLERANLITSDRANMAAVDGDRDGLRRGRWCRGLARHHLLLQTSTHPYGSPAGRLHRRYVIERQKF
jgi:hypothetical protein